MTHRTTHQAAELPTFFWLGFPILLVAMQILIEIFVPPQFASVLHSENGPHEILQLTFAVIALLYALRSLVIVVPQKQSFLIGWLICFALGCTYIAGEEISWGQHFFSWGTPEFWAGLNDQNETNLHNTTSWLDQKPRLILLIGVIVGGLVIPALQRLKPEILPQQFMIIYPPAILAPTAFLTVITKILDKVNAQIDSVIILSRGSEVEELFMFYFVMVYLLVLYRRIKLT